MHHECVERYSHIHTGLVMWLLPAVTSCAGKRSSAQFLVSDRFSPERPGRAVPSARTRTKGKKLDFLLAGSGKLRANRRLTKTGSPLSLLAVGRSAESVMKRSRVVGGFTLDLSKVIRIKECFDWFPVRFTHRKRVCDVTLPQGGGAWLSSFKWVFEPLHTFR